MYLYVIILKLSKFVNQTYKRCMVIQTHLPKLQTFKNSLILLQIELLRLGNWFKWWHRTLGLPNYGIISQIHSIDPLAGFHSPITHDDFEIIIIVVKAQCITTCDLLVIDECSWGHLLKILVTTRFLSSLWRDIWNLQTSLFKLTMKIQSPKVRPWKSLEIIILLA